jgi:hypothetical protein
MKKQQNIHDRDDVRPEEGENKYGDVAFADPVNKKYPIDTPEHVRAAWSYIHHETNASKYSDQEVSQLKDRIKAAAEKLGVHIQDH